ncbi:hypothetical protein CBE01nite_13170 [Clostridium beijerinckii]|uniref:AAA family ATPase n=1 Tax=Clostridium beijerinckii TaxID=1520 RepID=A0AB74V9K0_CLOBE|nr:AAA family ATPase [Clostridium beijerinckii]NRZ27248.1 midasin (ATPase involved in ribosome maturation) [Clostridium beijerinckii]NYB96956.1 midasin (ATPase involved in ribosome maturation) [Clostridium beijerinckii]OOM27143.1 AAA domain protein [Clostridium beijerinckii]QUN33110.1 AAA family ATPase [Clostridium beijerinckii]SQB11804.1 ATPase [Clostridium beijerinckii]
MSEIKALKPTVEILYAEELAALEANDDGPKPENWRLSPKAVRTFILGSSKPLKLKRKNVNITKKFYGDDALIERCIITLAGNRGLMLVGEPGTAKTMLSELLSAAICGYSTNTIQGTAGTTEDMIKYTWNYALLLAKGPVKEALVPSPLYIGMKKGTITRFEEITRCPAEVQDSLISILSDKVLNIPEFGEEGLLCASPGFNVIATANTRDRGVNEMSSFYYGDSKIDMSTMVQNILGSVLKESREDVDKLRSYFNIVVKGKSAKMGGNWKDFYEAKKWIK